MQEDKLVCSCVGVIVADIRTAIENGAKDFDAVQEATGVSSVCGACREYAENVVEAILNGE